jgi:RNA polymerase sigma-70 factor (ECF subfamily)
MVHPEDTTDLLTKAAQGNQSACTRLIHLHERAVAGTIYGILGVCPEAEDIGQEAFLRFFSSLGQFRGEASPATYLTRIAVNLCINEIRRRQRHRLLHLATKPEQMDQVPGPDGSGIRSIETIVVHNALQKIKPKYRTVLVLRHLNGLSTAETAAVLSLPVGTVLSRLSRAQDQLKKILDPAGKENHYAHEKKANNPA